MKVLLICSVWPEPGSSGASLRLMQWLRLLHSEGWSLTLASTAGSSEHAADLSCFDVECIEIAINCSSFDQFIGALNPDIVIFDRFNMEEQFGWRVARNCPQALRILETIDLHCLRMARHALFKQQAGIIADVDDAALYNETALREIASILRSDLAVMISDYEMALLQSRFAIPASQLHLCPFMFEQTPGKLPDYDERHDFICIGNFRHAPNADAVRWLKSELWPPIRAALPDTRLHIYGAYTPPAATAMHKPGDGFLVHGRAESVEPVMQRARINLAPLRFGAGLKTKIADAMRCGTPSITTRVGAEGMGDANPWAGAIAEDASQFISAAINLYQDHVAWQQARQTGLQIAGDLFNARQNGEALISRIKQQQANLAAHRLANFAGAMLNHHHHRSCEFMSRWIESKTKLAETPDNRE